VSPKDTIVGVDGTLTFVVDAADVGRAVGPQGRNVKAIEQALQKKVRVVPYDENMETFIRNLIRPLQIIGVERIENKIVLHPADSRSRSLLIGRNAQHLRTFEHIIKRFFPAINELKVA
ncbi:MAG: KH domain-containing protein, partial [Nanoarchaeota archaeon]